MRCEFCLGEGGPICIVCLKLASEGKLTHKDNCPWISRRGNCMCDRKETKKVASGMKVSFGKYRGEYIENLDSEYLQWCLDNLDWMKAPERKEFENQLAMRSGKGVNRGRV